MFVYEKRLQYPVHIHTPNAKLAKLIITQYGGPYAGWCAGQMRYTISSLRGSL